MRVFVIAYFLLMIVGVQAQSPTKVVGSVVYQLIIVNSQNQRLPNLTVKAIEQKSFQETQGVTNENGELTLNLLEGREWTVAVGEIKTALCVKAVLGAVVEVQKVYIYNVEKYKREQSQDITRTNQGFQKIIQQHHDEETFPEGKCMLNITVYNPKGGIVPNALIGLANTRDSLLYQATTSSTGKVTFIIPNKTNYDIDVNDLKNHSYCDFGDVYSIKNFSIQYVPTLVDEKVINDTIHQSVTESSNPSSERALIKIKVSGGKKQGVGEPVFIRNISTRQVYRTLTKNSQYAYFLLPVKTRYMVEFNYQKSVDVIDLMYAKDQTIGEYNITYVPNAFLEYPETFLPTTENLTVTDAHQLLKKEFKKPTDGSFFDLQIVPVCKVTEKSQKITMMMSLAGEQKIMGHNSPLNLVFVLDQSGSMYDEGKVEGLQKALIDFGEMLSSKDRISVVLFDNNAYKVAQITQDHKQQLKVVSKRYRPGGATNILEGLDLAFETIAKDLNEKYYNRVVLLTDGEDSFYTNDKILTVVEQKKPENVEVSTIGVGKYYNQYLLKMLAKQGNGSFNGVTDPTDFSKIFLEGISSLLVQRLKIEIFSDEELMFSSFDGGHSFKNIYGQKTRIQIGNVFPHSNEISFVDMKITKSLQGAKSIKVKVSYYDMLRKESVSYMKNIRVAWSKDEKPTYLIDQEELELYAISTLNTALKRMAKANEKQDYETAQLVLKEGKKEVEMMYPSKPPIQVGKLLKEISRYLKLIKQIEKNK